MFLFIVSALNIIKCGCWFIGESEVNGSEIPKKIIEPANPELSLMDFFLIILIFLLEIYIVFN